MIEKIKEWYQGNFPDDEVGEKLNGEASFTDFFVAVATGTVYKTMGVGDSLVRERLFERLSEILGKPYAYVYDIWLAGSLEGVM